MIFSRGVAIADLFHVVSWMNGLELGETNVRDQSMHPLWEEYAFKKEPVHGAPIEIDDDEDEIRNVFYFK
jgi:hypothetical protein